MKFTYHSKWLITVLVFQFLFVPLVQGGVGVIAAFSQSQATEQSPNEDHSPSGQAPEEGNAAGESSESGEECEKNLDDDEKSFLEIYSLVRPGLKFSFLLSYSGINPWKLSRAINLPPPEIS